jgi:ribbon-helix-helix CopG family protein
VAVVKRLQIMIDEDLDRILGRLALAEGTSKAALIRRFVHERVGATPPIEGDALVGMTGEDDFAPEGVDDVVYP